MAWLAAVPKPPPGSRRAEQSATVNTVSRADQLKKDGITPRMPPNDAPHIVNRLIEIGLTDVGGMGAIPLTWLSINEWQKATRVTLSSWEARLLRRLSIDYLAESRRAECETSPPPWGAKVTQREIETEESRLRMVLG